MYSYVKYYDSLKEKRGKGDHQHSNSDGNSHSLANSDWNQNNRNRLKSADELESLISKHVSDTTNMEQKTSTSVMAKVHEKVQYGMGCYFPEPLYISL